MYLVDLLIVQPHTAAICAGSAVATKALGATLGGNAQPAPTVEAELKRFANWS